jgi:hypothetical protein
MALLRDSNLQIRYEQFDFFPVLLRHMCCPLRARRSFVKLAGHRLTRVRSDGSSDGAQTNGPRALQVHRERPTATVVPAARRQRSQPNFRYGLT